MVDQEVIEVFLDELSDDTWLESILGNMHAATEITSDCTGKDDEINMTLVKFPSLSVIISISA